MTEPKAFLLKNAQIHTMDTPAQAEAMLIKDGRIAGIGMEKDMEGLSLSGVEMIDVGGRTVLPGFFDSHVHFTDACLSKNQLDLGGCSTFEVIREKLAEAVKSKKPGEWIQGRGWSKDALGRFPEAADLDAATPDNPVALKSYDEHLMLANTCAMKTAGLLDGPLPKVEGGEAVTDSSGKPNGLFKESACSLIRKAIPAPTVDFLLEILKAGMEEAAKLGLTSIEEPGDLWSMHEESGFRAWEAWQALRDEDKLTLRVSKWVNPMDLDAAIERHMKTGNGDEWLHVGPYKIFADGALGSRTACMLEPYEGTKDKGIAIHPGEELFILMQKAATFGLGLGVHAIGDAANRRVLDAFQSLREHKIPLAAARIEHAQCLSETDLTRFGRLGVAASMQPFHLEDDIAFAKEAIGDRSRFLYAFKALFDSGARMCFGSDAPIADMSPLKGMALALTRTRLDGTPKGGFYPEQRISPQDALFAYTLGAAQVSGVAPFCGSLTSGKAADFCVLSPGEGPMDRAPAWLEATVDATCVGGRFSWRNF